MKGRGITSCVHPETSSLDIPHALKTLFIQAALSGEADDGTHLKKTGVLHFPLNQDI